MRNRNTVAVPKLVPVFCIVSLLMTPAGSLLSTNNPWLPEPAANDTIATRIMPPDGYHRVDEPEDGFGNGLRNLPLKTANSPVRLFNGEMKRNQEAHAAVVDIDVGKTDLQQCADAVIRLRAEYLYDRKLYAAIRFRLTSGDAAEYLKWAEGFRPSTTGNRVIWKRTSSSEDSYRSFRKYLDVVFTYAGTYSLSREMTAVDVGEMQIGDVFLQGGFPGHAVLVVDMARRADGKAVFLLAQSFMPAQEVHVLKNPRNPQLSPWYELAFGEQLDTPEWVFRAQDLKRFVKAF